MTNPFGGSNTVLPPDSFYVNTGVEQGADSVCNIQSTNIGYPGITFTHKGFLLNHDVVFDGTQPVNYIYYNYGAMSVSSTATLWVFAIPYDA